MVSSLDPQLFRPVSPKLMWARLLPAFAIALLMAIGGGVGVVLLSWWCALAIGAAVIMAAWLGWLIPRQVRALGYRIDERDLHIARGIMFRHLTSVPMGRLQFLTVERGPLERAFGLATLTLHTASAATDASIPGLPEEEATSLRESLSARGGAHLMGL